MAQIKKENDLVGKTIAGVECAYYDVWVGFRFTDGDFAIFKTSVGDENASMELEEESDDELLRDLGVITADEYQRRREAQRTQADAARDERERREFERLSQKFGTATERTS